LPPGPGGPDLVQLVARSADLTYLEHFAYRVRELDPCGNHRLTRLQQRFEAVGLGRGQTQNGAVLQQCTIHIASRAVQGHPNAALYLGQRRARRGRACLGTASRARRPDVDNGASRCVIGDRDGLHQGERRRVETVNGNGVAGFDRVRHRRREVRRRFDLGAAGEDEPVDIAARGQRELLNFSSLHRQLLRIIERRPSSRCRVLSESVPARGNQRASK
jgi:hypothetical protein